jgi:flagellar protein FliO/FliZ
MMVEYLLRLALLLPLVGGLAWGTLWLWRRLQMGLPVAPSTSKPARMIDVLPLGTGGKLAVVEFAGKQLLVAVSRNQISLIADDNAGDFHAD